MLLPDARVEEDGVVVVPASRLVSVLREVGEGTKDITLVGADGRLDIDTEQCHFRIHGDDPAEFPAVPAFPATALASVDSAVLRGMIDRTLFATAREPGRFALHGVQLRFSKGELELVATDGRRLAKAVTATEGGPAQRGARDRRDEAPEPAVAASPAATGRASTWPSTSGGSSSAAGTRSCPRG